MQVYAACNMMWLLHNIMHIKVSGCPKKVRETKIYALDLEKSVI